VEPHATAQWLAARKVHLAKVHLAKEKAFTKARDQLSAERRQLPWERVEKPYAFDTPNGKETLSDLFDGRSQRLPLHAGSGMGGGLLELLLPRRPFRRCGRASRPARRDAARGLARAARRDRSLQAAHGWRFKWVSSYGNDFNCDYHVSFSPDDEAGGQVDYKYETQDFVSDEMPGASVFYKDATGAIFHTYSAYARGLDILVGAYNFLDLTPKGRDEDALPWTTARVRRHDEYKDAKRAGACCGSHD